MKILNNVKHRHAICLKFGGRYFTSLAMLRWEAKASKFVHRLNELPLQYNFDDKSNLSCKWPNYDSQPYALKETITTFCVFHRTWNLHFPLKELPNLYYMHYSCVAIILFITDISEPAFSTYSLNKTIFFCVLFFVWFILNSKSSLLIFYNNFVIIF